VLLRAKPSRPPCEGAWIVDQAADWAADRGAAQPGPPERGAISDDRDVFLGFLLAGMRSAEIDDTMSGLPIRCLIVDDHRPFLEAARVLLEREGLSVVGVAVNGAEGLRSAEVLQPDVVLVDVSLGEESGFDVARSLMAQEPADGRVVVLISTRSEGELTELIAESPAAGFVSKAELSAKAIRRIVAGGSDESP
jgi:CheY-like chemotaxis protein